MDLTYNEYCMHISSICSLTGPSLQHPSAMHNLRHHCSALQHIPSRFCGILPYTSLANLQPKIQGESSHRLACKFQLLPAAPNSNLWPPNSARLCICLGSLSCDMSRICPKPQTGEIIGLILCLSFISACSSMLRNKHLSRVFTSVLEFSKRAIHYQLLCHGWKWQSPMFNYWFY